MGMLRVRAAAAWVLWWAAALDAAGFAVRGWCPLVLILFLLWGRWWGRERILRRHSGASAPPLRRKMPS